MIEFISLDTWRIIHLFQCTVLSCVMGCRCVSRRQVYGKHHCLVPSHHGKLLCVFKLNFPLCMHHVKTAGRGQVSVPVRYSIVNQFSHDTAALPSVHSTKLNHHPIFSHHHINPGLQPTPFNRAQVGTVAYLPCALATWRMQPLPQHSTSTCNWDWEAVCGDGWWKLSVKCWRVVSCDVFRCHVIHMSCLQLETNLREVLSFFCFYCFYL